MLEAHVLSIFSHYVNDFCVDPRALTRWYYHYLPGFKALEFPRCLCCITFTKLAEKLKILKHCWDDITGLERVKQPRLVAAG